SHNFISSPPSQPTSHILLSFSFPPSLPHRHLHSFPTRRSSDLGRRHAPLPEDRASLRCRPRERGRATSGRRARASRRPCGYAIRSEEHTSELQSRFDLVCRLLLEKKKLYVNNCVFDTFDALLDL